MINISNSIRLVFRNVPGIKATLDDCVYGVELKGRMLSLEFQPEERQRLTGRGAVVVGLGEMGKLSADGVTEAVRGGVLRYLLHASDRYGEERPTACRTTPIRPCASGSPAC